MRSIRTVALAALLATVAPGPRQAAAKPVGLAGGELTLGIAALPVLRLPLASTTVLVSSQGSFTLPAGLVTPTRAALPRSLFTGIPQLSGIRVTGVSNAALDFEAESGLGVGPLAGTLFLDVLQLFELTLPLSVVGSPGASHGCPCEITVDVFGRGWTSRTTSVTGLSPVPLSPWSTRTFQGSDARSAGHAGDLALVSPFKVVSNVAGTFAGFATLDLHFTPEPHAVVLLGTALAGVAWLARRRRTRRSETASSPDGTS